MFAIDLPTRKFRRMPKLLKLRPKFEQNFLFLLEVFAVTIVDEPVSGLGSPTCANLRAAINQSEKDYTHVS